MLSPTPSPHHPARSEPHLTGAGAEPRSHGYAEDSLPRILCRASGEGDSADATNTERSPLAEPRMPSVRVDKGISPPHHQVSPAECSLLWRQPPSSRSFSCSPDFKLDMQAENGENISLKETPKLPPKRQLMLWLWCIMGIENLISWGIEAGQAFC